MISGVVRRGAMAKKDRQGGCRENKLVLLEFIERVGVLRRRVAGFQSSYMKFDDGGSSNTAYRIPL